MCILLTICNLYFIKNNLYQIVLQTVRTVSRKSWDFSRISENHSGKILPRLFAPTAPSSWEFSGLHWNRNGLKILGNSWEWNGFLFDSGILGNSGEQEHFKGRYSKKKNKFPGIFRVFQEWSEFNSNYINNQNSQIWLAINCTDFSLNRTLRVMSK